MQCCRQIFQGFPSIVLQIIQAQQDILVKEKELESARKKLEIIRKTKYKNRPVDYDSGSDF